MQIDIEEKSLDYIRQFKGVKSQFWNDGYVILPKVFKPQEIDVIKNVIQNCSEMNDLYLAAKKKYDSGQYPSFQSIFVMNDVFGNDVFSKATRNYKLLDMVSYLFDDDGYIYHNKVALKYGKTVGFKYHQDYFYWYQMGCLLPNMATCFIAIDQATKENGCLKIYPGTHKMGRVEHVLYDGFTDSEVAPDRLQAVQDRYEEVYLELDPGDAVLFHCNTFHGSDPNLSDHSRLALLGCYNTKNNSPINRESVHPPYSYQERIFDQISEDDAQCLPDFSVSFEQ